ncbi:MAG TPA: zinc-dependent alcohol dehydrogenase family protein [Limnochordales bacterium]
MRVQAAVLHQCGVAAPYASSKPLEVTQLELTGPGPGEVLVRVAAAGVCHSDLSVVNGTRPRPVPMVLGHEGSGIVVDVGPGVTRVRPGDHVVFIFVPMCGKCAECLSGRPYLCMPGQAANRAGTLVDGGTRFRFPSGGSVYHHLGVSAFAEHTVVHETSVVPIERDVPLEIAALFGCAVMTGVGAVVNTARVEPGTAVIVFGMGGVGLSAVMGARLSGAWPVIAADIVDAKLELARKVGATHVVNAAAPDWLDQVRDLTGGGADYAIEAVGSENAVLQAFQVIKPGGLAVAAGLPHPSRRLNLPAVALAGEGKRLVGTYMGSSVPLRDLPRYVRLYKAGLLPVDRLVTSVIGLDQVNEAMDRLERSQEARQVIRFDGGPMGA